MRAFFVLMLLLNAGVFALFTIDARDDASPYPPRPAEGSLHLADEATGDEEAPVDQPPAPEVEDTPPAAAAEEPDIRCFQLEGLGDRTAAEALAATVRTDGGVASVTAREGRDFVGYWVYVPPHDTMSAAQETMAELAEQGISDYGYVGGDDEHAVSLGVFSSRERALEREREIQELGIETELGDRYRTVTEYALLVGVDDPDALPPGDWQTADCQDIGD